MLLLNGLGAGAEKARAWEVGLLGQHEAVEGFEFAIHGVETDIIIRGFGVDVGEGVEVG